jgi:hypothetical protein
MHTNALSRKRAASDHVAYRSRIKRFVHAFSARKKTKPGTRPGFGCCFFLAEDPLGVP